MESIDQIEDTSSVVELRQYTLHPGKRDTLIELFDREFVESQEATGMRILGQFRDANDPNRFVWLRGFADMATRASALQAFYGGPVWKAHRNEANATMVDSSDVLLLRPVDARSGFKVPKERPPVGTPQRVTSTVVATIYLLVAPVDREFLQFFSDRVSPVMTATGAAPMARFQTEDAHNDFPALPVREGEHAFVWFASFASAGDYKAHLTRLSESKTWNETVRPQLVRRLKAPMQMLELHPTARSLVGHTNALGYTTERTGELHDFDFIAGRWTVVNRRLNQRGVGSEAWDEFPATSRGVLHLGGIANVDEIEFPTKGWSGMTVRVFNPEKHQWSIYWISSRTGTLFPPVVGGFDGDRGEFYGEDEDEGRPVKVRYIWTKNGPDAARWEQAFAYGATWETNWVMEFTRQH